MTYKQLQELKEFQPSEVTEKHDSVPCLTDTDHRVQKLLLKFCLE